MNIKKLEQIKTALSKILEIEKVEMRSMTDESGQIIEWEKDTPTPEVDDVLYIAGGEDEERAIAPAGEYFITNEIGEKIKLTVGEDGVITAVETVTTEDISEDDENPVEPEAEEVIEAEDEEVPVEDEEVAPESIEEPEVIEDTTKALEEEIEALKAEIEALKAENEELKAKIAELETEPQVEPVQEQFEAMMKKQKSSGALKYAQALKK